MSFEETQILKNDPRHFRLNDPDHLHITTHKCRTVYNNELKYQINRKKIFFQKDSFFLPVNIFTAILDLQTRDSELL